MTAQHTPDLAYLLADALADMDGMDEEDLRTLRWSGGTEQEPIGTAWGIDYYPKGERLAEIVEQHFTQQFSELQAKYDELLAALMKLQEWAKAYPIDVFPEPDMKIARVALESHGITLDAVSASAMRHVITQTTKIVNEAIAKHSGSSHDERG